MCKDSYIVVQLSTYQSAKPENVKDINEVMMIALHRMCEDKQREHIHISDSSRGQAKYDVSHSTVMSRSIFITSPPQHMYYLSQILISR